MIPYKTVSTTMDPSINGFRNLFLSRYGCMDKYLRDAIAKDRDKSDIIRVSDAGEGLPTTFYVICRVNEIRIAPKSGHYQFTCQQYTEGKSYVFNVGCRQDLESASLIYRGAHVAFLTRQTTRGWVCEKIIWPGDGLSVELPKGRGKVVVISDVHVGADDFSQVDYVRFTKHLNEIPGVTHLLVVGDIVSGVGVYPNQDAKYNTIDAQTSKLIQMLKLIKPEVKIVIIPGNHCFTNGLGEPQQFLDSFKSVVSAEIPNAYFFTNPAFLVINNVKFMLYHGRVMDSLVRDISSLTYSNIEESMHLLLRSRHLAPIIDERAVAIPTKHDNMLIEDFPHVFCTGHVHKGVCTFRQGVLLVNPGSFQKETDLQRRVKIVPQIGSAVVIDCSDLSKTKLYRYQDEVPRAV